MSPRVTLITASCAAALLAACGGASDDAPIPTATTCDAVDASNYLAFDASHYENQLARVDAYEAIKAKRKSASFSAADFGDLGATNPALSSPHDETFASLYVETAGLAAKVLERSDDHDYALAYELADGTPVDAVGPWLDERLRAAITDGAAAGAVAAGEFGSIQWHSQLLDKGLQHFFYLSVHHEMVLGTRKNWDEAFGYYGRATDRSTSEGLAATVASRDADCDLGLNDEIFALLVQGQCVLGEALTAAGADEVDVGSVPALVSVIDAVDGKLLTALAISAAREFAELPGSAEPAVKLAEGRAFFYVLEPFMTAEDAAATAAVRVEAEKDDPATVDAALVVDTITALFGIESTFAACGP